VYLGLPARVAAGAAATAPIAAWQAWRVWRGGWADPARWNSLGFWAVALLMGTATAVAPQGSFTALFFDLFLPDFCPQGKNQEE
jgi:hypothetical protein